MNAEPKTNGDILKKVIIVLLVINLVVSCGVVGYLVKTDRKGEEVVSTEVLKEDETVGEYVIYIGTNDKDTYKQEIPTKEARKIVNDICVKYVDGYTTYDAQGGWVDEKGVLTQENSMVYMFQGASRDKIKSIMDEVLKALNQNSIMIETRSTDATYYDGTNDDWGK